MAIDNYGTSKGNVNESENPKVNKHTPMGHKSAQHDGKAENASDQSRVQTK
jgi:hypothetical protein